MTTSRSPMSRFSRTLGWKISGVTLWDGWRSAARHDRCRSALLSGDSLQLVNLTGKQIQQSIKPRHYGPTGELAVSADMKTALAVSWYVPAHSLAHEGPLPTSTPELLVLRLGANLHLDAALPIHGYGLKASGWLENRRPRISSDGSIIAVAQDSGVTVLARNPLAFQHPYELRVHTTRMPGRLRVRLQFKNT
jgi:hypothetical protein